VLLALLRASWQDVRSEDVSRHKHKQRLKYVKGQYEVEAFSPRSS